MKVSIHTSCFILLLVLGGALPAKAQTSQESYREQFSSSVLEFDRKGTDLLQNSSGRYPVVVSYFFDSLFGWKPDGKKNNKVAVCQPKTLVASKEFPNNLASCVEGWETGHTSVLRNISQMLAVRLDLDKQTFIHPLTLHLPGDIKLRGVLALKGDQKKRPLVIIRSGIFSGVDIFLAERPWYIMLFEQAPFNILILENLTSSQFIDNNTKFSLGGFDEGIQNIWLAQRLQSPQEPISKIIDSVHMFGISLGGHGVLYASLLNKYNSIKKPLVRSYIALCPVVDLKPTMMNLVYSGGLKSVFVDWWGRRRIHAVEKKMTIESYPAFSFLYTTVEELSKTYKGSLLRDKNIKLPPGQQKITDFWALNDFWPYYEDVHEPVYIFTNVYDPAVPAAMNTDQIRKTLSTTNRTKNIRTFSFKQGTHCTLPVAYDWGSLGEMFGAIILDNSPDFKQIQITAEQKLPQSGYEVQSWDVENVNIEKDIIQIKFNLKNKSQVSDYMMDIAVSKLDFTFHDKHSTEDLQLMLERWLHLNLNIEIKADRLRLSWLVAK